jgi:hypothetical protein
MPDLLTVQSVADDAAHLGMAGSDLEQAILEAGDAGALDRRTLERLRVEIRRLAD